MAEPKWYSSLKGKISISHYSEKGSTSYQNERLGKIEDELAKTETVVDGVTLEFRHEAYFDTEKQEPKLAWVFWEKDKFDAGYGISFDPFTKDQIVEKLKIIPAAKPEEKPAKPAAVSTTVTTAQAVQKKVDAHMSEEKTALQTLAENAKRSAKEAGKLAAARMAMETAKAPIIAKLASKYGKDEGTKKAIVEFLDSEAGTAALMLLMSGSMPFVSELLPKKMRAPALAASEVMMTRGGQMAMEGVGMEVLDVVKTFVTMYMATQDTDEEEETNTRTRIADDVMAEIAAPKAAETVEVVREEAKAEKKARG